MQQAHSDYTPIIALLCEGQIEIAEYLAASQDCRENLSFFNDYIQVFMSKLLSSSKDAFQAALFHDQASKKWHEKWRGKLIESLPYLSEKDFLEKTKHHTLLCVKTSSRKAPCQKQWKIQPAYNNEKIVFIPPIGADGLSSSPVYKFHYHYLDMLIPHNLRTLPQCSRPYITGDYFNSSSALDIFQQIQIQNSLECYIPSKIHFSPQMNLVFEQTYLPLSSPLRKQEFLSCGLVNPEDHQVVFLTKDNHILYIRDAKNDHCCAQGDLVKLVEGPCALINPFSSRRHPEQESLVRIFEYLDQKIPLEKRISYAPPTFKGKTADEMIHETRQHIRQIQRSASKISVMPSRALSVPPPTLQAERHI